MNGSSAPAAASPTARTAVPLVEGAWSPSAQIAYGIACATFQPVANAQSTPEEASANVASPYQVQLEVGDEVYVVEVFRPSRRPATRSSTPSSAEEGVWYRGFVVSTAPHPRRPSAAEIYAISAGSTSYVAPVLAQEPQVSLGIFPASHVQIHEHLADDAERILSQLVEREERGTSTPAGGSAGGGDMLRSSSKTGPLGRATAMEILQEEDEPDDDDRAANSGKNSRRQSKLVQLKPTGSPNKTSNRSSVGTAAAFGHPRSTEQRAGSRSPRLSTASRNAERLPPPLPNLKCGDETASGVEEPLVDEIACALREWASLLYTHLFRRDYALFNSAREHITALHAIRKQLLSKSLSVSEIHALRREAVARLVQGNIEQGLDVIVRNPRSGGLVDIGVGLDVDRKSWMSVVNMYSAQVALAHGAPMQEKKFAQDSPTSPAMSVSDCIVLDVRQLVAQIAAPGEFVELAFSLFAKGGARFVSEEFCVVLDSTGSPIRDVPLRTIFRDLSPRDISDQLFLVCRVIHNGSYRGSGGGSGTGGPAPGSPSPKFTSTSPQLASTSSIVGTFVTRSDSASIDASSLQKTLGSELREDMLFTDSSGRLSCRRPFGCAVVDLSQLEERAAEDATQDLFGALAELRMPIYVPASEASFATLHEDIISGRAKEIEKHSRADYVSVGVGLFRGDDSSIAQRQRQFLADSPTTGRLGFADVIRPGDQRNDVYLTLLRGDFRQNATSHSASTNGGGNSTFRTLAQLAGGGGAGSFEVQIAVRTREGAFIERTLSRGTGQLNVSRYASTVLSAQNSPAWNELVKLDFSAESMADCHLFLTFSNRARAAPDSPFAFAYFPLFSQTGSPAFQPDGSHTLVLYRYDQQIALPAFYFQVPPTVEGSGQAPKIPPAVSKTLFPLRDTVVLGTHLVSSVFTQDETILRLLQWQTELANDQGLMRATLAKLTFCSEIELCKFLRGIMDALFNILVSPLNPAGELDDLLFQALVKVLGFVSDKRLTSFQPVLEHSISQSSASSAAATHIVVGSLTRLLRKPADQDTATVLRSSIKVLKWLLRIAVRSHDVQRDKELSVGTTSTTLEAGFKSDISALLGQLNGLMRMTTPPSLIGTQTLVLQHFVTILPELATIYDTDELLEIVMGFVDSVGNVQGKKAVWKILCLRQIAEASIFALPAGRAALLPCMIRWLKPCLGKFDELAMCSPQDPQAARDNARVNWIEGIRLVTGVIAAMLDVIHEALINPSLPRDIVAQEHDNVEYLLALVPRLLEAYRELENLANLDAVERQRSPASNPAVIPKAFPASYPVSLLSYAPEVARRRAAGQPMPSSKVDGARSTWPTLRQGVGDIACVFLSLIQLAPRATLVNWLDSTVEVEGRDRFARQLGLVFRAARGMLANEAFPADWLNANALGHRAVLKLVGPAAEVLTRDFVSPMSSSFQFNTSLWRDFFAMLLELLASPHLLIEDFSPQKRRAVWRLAGDIRGEGAQILSQAWTAVARTDGRQGTDATGYQLQFVPILVEKILSLCLSHHDELRRVAVQILHSMIVAEYDAKKHFAIIEAECIDKLDKLFGQQSKGDEISRTFFITQLRQVSDEVETDDGVRAQVASFLTSIDTFLDLLLAVRNLPEGSEYQEDRIISTLRLMTFIRGIGRSEIFIRYVQRLVDYHAALGNYVEAGLTLKLHADLHRWDLATFLDPVPDLELPRQTEFARKETLYLRILVHLGKGQAYESGIELVRELEIEYERTFNYPRLAELLDLKAELFSHIAQADRHFGNFFRVAFFGTRWPAPISGKHFVYRGEARETLEDFTDRMMNQHPFATLLRSSEIPPEEVQFGENQFLQITAVVAEVDESSRVFTDPEVPHYVRSYYLQNEVNTFSFTRPFTRDDAGSRRRSAGNLSSTWTEKTVLICEDSFPTVLRRSEVVEIRLIEISPVENAVRDVQSQQRELVTLERRYRALVESQQSGQINSGPLYKALSKLCDPPTDQGVPMYSRVFLQPEHIATLPPAHIAIVRQLEAAIDELVITIARCLKLHASIIAADMRHSHELLEGCFEKNFAPELARLPDRGFYEPSSLIRARPSSDSTTVQAAPRLNGGMRSNSRSNVPRNAGPPVNGSASASRRESVITQAANDQSLVTRAVQAQPSSPIAEHTSISSTSRSKGRDERTSPTKSLGSATRAAIVNGDGTTPTRRNSLLQVAIRKLGRRKGSEVDVVDEE